MTELEQFRKDLEALERWLKPGTLDTRKLSLDQLAPLSEAVAEFTSKMIAFRMGLNGIVEDRRRRQSSN